ncbi:PREDICTED: uncharacterized protein LOC109191252 [Ipomoea nil]|uniref:uncharacterized protein LOC109191252 n=1 Tax=Ipomoea nil TaxID=35883 RepID=UPI0009011736|nr:PREDICTED: uncharacterized protein LOC109191252 [Ipomoea nil]
MRSLSTIQRSYSAKLSFSFLQGGSLWSDYMHARYSDADARPSDSLARRRMRGMEDFVEENTIRSSGSLIWTPSSYGNFTFSTSYDALRERKGVCLSSSSIWGRQIPFKVSVFMWKLLKRFLPFLDVVERFGFCLPSMCPFYTAASASLEHCLVSCTAVQEVWIHFGRLSGLFGNLDSVRATCHSWWLLASPGSAVGSITCFLPCLILWFLWVEYNNCIYNGSAFSPEGVIKRVKRESYFVSLAFPRYASILGVVLLSDGLVARFAVQRRRNTIWVKWLAPPTSRLKLNTDVIFTTAGAAGGACLRDSRGLLFAGLTFSLEATSALEAEAMALCRSLQWCDTMVLRPFIIEVDSLELVRLSSVTEARIPWRIKETVSNIRSYLFAGGSSLNHVYREANQVADALAAEGLAVGSPAIFSSFTALPFKAKLALLYDFRGFATLRAISL